MTTCTAHCMPLTYSRLQALLSHFQITPWVSISLREWGSGTLLKKLSERISTPLKRPFGKPKAKSLLFLFMRLLISWIFRQELDILLISKQDFGRLNDMREDLEILLIHLRDFSDSLSTWKHFGCQLWCWKYSLCQHSCHGSSCHWLTKLRFCMCIQKPLRSWFLKRPLVGFSTFWQLAASWPFSVSR